MAVNFRSCSGELNRLRRSYHAGETSDLTWVIEQLIAEDKQRPIVCIGVSLGGNVLLKYLGEQGEQVPAQVRAAVAISTPFDLGVAVKHVERGFRRIYMWRFLRKMKLKAYAKLQHFPDLVDPVLLQSVHTIADFDHLITAPENGFRDGHHYWQSCSSITFLAAIRRPTLLINAKDDPFFPGEALPEQQVLDNPLLTGEFTSSGGHVGFIAGGWPFRPTTWVEQRAVGFLKTQLGTIPSKSS